MRIELTCSECNTFQMSVDVTDLDYDPVSKVFSMRLCAGDDWFQKVTFANRTAPNTVSIQDRLARIHFERYSDAADFGAWLIDGERIVQEGFRTMRG